MKTPDEGRESAFTKLPWHDAKLLELRIARDSELDQDNLACIVEFMAAHNSWRRAVVTLRNCTIVKVDLDLDGKRICADSIFSATCERDPALKTSLEAGQLRGERHPLADYYHFHILLVSPGGELSVFAKDFDVAWRH